MPKYKVLIIEDDPLLRELASALLETSGYEPLEAGDGKDGLSMAFAERPDLILLDRGMPDMDGVEVLRRLRANFVTTHIPVILVSGRHELNDRLEGLASGADDYIIKPYDRQELMARVGAVIRRTQQSLGADPLTKLPGNLVLRHQFQQRLAAGNGVCIGYVDVDNFKAYVDHYGFEAAAFVIQKAAQMLYAAVTDHGDPQDFIGHIGGDDFLLLSTTSKIDHVAAALVESFAALAPQFYSDGDRARGYIEGKDRFGTMRQFPLVSLSVVIICIPPGAHADPDHVAAYAAHCKTELKRDRGKGWKRFEYVL